MGQNFIGCDREQSFLMPPSLRDWLPEDHLAWTVLDAVEAMDLSAFYSVYRADGHGRPAYEPSMMVALLLYAYARGNRSSRGIERECREDVAYRVIAANRVPDHSTIAEFCARHESALAGLFGEVLALCKEAGLVKVGVIMVDGTKIHGNASNMANRDYRQIAEEILADHARTDREEDELYGDRRGDELPIEVSSHNGRRAWLREAKRRLDEKREQEPKPVPKSRPARLRDAKDKLQDELWAEQRANEAYEQWRARGISADGYKRMAPGTTKPYVSPEVPEGKVNITDPDSRNLKAFRGYVQGYNAQAVVTEDHIVIAAEIKTSPTDFGYLGPMVDVARRQLAQAGVTDEPVVVLADSGYWHNEQMDHLTGEGLIVLVPPDSTKRKAPRPGWTGGRFEFMRTVLSTDTGRELYEKRHQTIEPIFGQIKFNRHINRFLRRGRGAALSQWRLATATHNLLKLHQHRIAALNP
jgi:transposase